MSDGSRGGSVRTNVCLAVALAALTTPAAAAETWLHPVLPHSVVKAAPTPARRGARPARPSAAAPVYPFPTAYSGESSLVELTTGTRYPEPGTAVPAERIDRSWVRLGAARPMPLTGAKPAGASTRLEATWAGQGLATLGILLHPEARTVEAEEFEAFLREAGATAALEERSAKKETKKAAKTVAVESARAFAGIVEPRRSASPVDPAAGLDEPLGLPLEIVALAPPLALRAGSPVSVAVFLDGRAAPGAAVRAFVPGKAEPSVHVADAQGHVALPLEQEGRLLLATAAVRRTAKADRARGEAWKKAEWEIQRSTLELLVLPKAPDPTPTPTPKGRRAAPKKKPG